MADAIRQEATAPQSHDDHQQAVVSQPDQESHQPEEPAESAANPQENAIQDAPAVDTLPIACVNDAASVEGKPETEAFTQQQERDPEQPAADEQSTASQPVSSQPEHVMHDTATPTGQAASSSDVTGSTSSSGEMATSSDAREEATLSEAHTAALLNIDNASDNTDKVDVEMQPVAAPEHAPSLFDSAPTISTAANDVSMQQEAPNAANGDADMNGHLDPSASDVQPKQESAGLTQTADESSVPTATGENSMEGSKDQDGLPTDKQENGDVSATEGAQSGPENGRKATTQEQRDADGFHAMKIYIGGLPERTERRDLEDCFGQFGEISHIELRIGFAFIEYATAEGAKGAIEEYDGGHFLGAEIMVQASKSRTTQTKSIIENTCFTCGEHGHYARNCPKDPRNSSKASSGGSELRDSYRAPPSDTIHPSHRDSYRPGGGARDRDRSPPPRRRDRDDRDRRRDHDARAPRAGVSGIDRYVSSADYDRRGPPPRSRDDRDRDFRDRDRDRDRDSVRGHLPHSAPGYIDSYSGRGPNRDSRGPVLPPQDMYDRDRRDRMDAARDMDRRDRRPGSLPYYDSGRPPYPPAMEGPPGYPPPGQGYGYTPERGAPAGYGYPPGIPPQMGISMPGRGYSGPQALYSAPPPARGDSSGRSNRRDDAPGYFPGASGVRDDMRGSGPDSRSSSGPSGYGLPNAPGYTPYGGSAPDRGPYSASLPPSSMPLDPYGRPLPGPYSDFPARPPGSGYGYPSANAGRPGYDAPPDSRRDSRDRYDRR